MKPALLLLALLSIAFAREERVINRDWDFHLGKLDGPEKLDAPGTDWQRVHLPHDWAIAGPFDPKVSGEQGKLPWKGQGWYKKDLVLTEADLAGGRRAILLFDGVMANPTVYVNGKEAGGWTYGYNSFHLDVTDLVKPGTNQLAVHVSTEAHYSRWYPGAGIYRKVRLILTDPVHIPVWGVSVTTPEITDQSAKLHVTAEVRNSTDSEAVVTTLLRILDPEGEGVAEAKVAVSVEAGQLATVELPLEVLTPKRWDVDHPNLYTAFAEIRSGDKLIDSLSTRFGIRTFEWTHDDGFHLNGRRVQLYGVCLHHDNGPLGAALFRDSLVRKLTIMKDMGVNAIRTSHNAPSPEMLEICDEMGLVVIDELFDKYGPTASVQTSSVKYVDEYAEDQVRNFVRRDRNHPSVVMWSVGNEMPDVLGSKNGDGKRMMEKMQAFFNKYDPTRPTNMACHMTSGVDNGSLEPLDTTGWNYGQRYTNAHRKYPEQPIIYTESASAFSTRGFYQFPHPKNRNDFNKNQQESSYDLTSATWSDIPDVEFMRMERDKFIAGEFVWTGFDYLGEPTPHTKEARSSYFGIVDLVGLKKDRYHLYRSYWNDDDHTVHILPHWTWPDRVGKNVPVYVYTDGDEAELFLNGKSLGRRTKETPEQIAKRALRQISFGKPADASSEEMVQDQGGNVVRQNRADMAFDGDTNTRWCASSGDFPQWLSVDLGEPQPIRHVAIHWEKNTKDYTYALEVSNDGKIWREIGTPKDARTSQKISRFAPDEKARYVRVVVTAASGNAWASIAEVEVESAPPSAEDISDDPLDPYYAITDRYRLRWEDVTYEPGALGVVAYKDGVEIGRSTVQTAGDPATLRLTAEPVYGDDLRYIEVDAIDAKGNLCPHDMSMVDFKVTGPATIAGIGNGDPMSFDPFQDARHPLFFGKAVLILRLDPTKKGDIQVTATTNGMKPATLKVE